jgi:hypothetical protein
LGVDDERAELHRVDGTASELLPLQWRFCTPEVAGSSVSGLELPRDMKSCELCK